MTTGNEQLEVSPVATSPAPTPEVADLEGLEAGLGSPRRWRTFVLAGGAYLIISLFIWSNVWRGHPTSTTTCGCGDSATYLWFLEWQAHAIAHGLNPFYSTAMNHPTGINLMNNPIGVVLAPITWIFGPVATLNVILTLSAPLSALAMFALLRRWVSWMPAAFIGGLFYGFSPFILENLTESHTDFGLAVAPPLIIICLDELLFRQGRRPTTTGILLGLLVTLQFFIGSELLVMTAIVGVVGLFLVADHANRRHPEIVREHKHHIVVGLSSTAITAAVLLVYPVWYAFAGPVHFTGAVWPKGVKNPGTELRDFLLPNQNVLLPGISQVTNHLTGGYQGFVISPQYFGFGILVVLVGGLVIWRHDRRLWLFGAIALFAVVLSLGDGSKSALTWGLFVHVPVLQDVIPGRFVFFTYLATAVMLALIVDHTYLAVNRRRSMAQNALPREAGDVRWSRLPSWSGAVAGVIVAAIALVPPALYIAQTVPFTTEPVVLPPWFQTVAPHLSGHQVLLVFPAPFSGDQSAVAWQAVNGINYAMVGESGPGGVVSRAKKKAREGQSVIAHASSAIFPDLDLLKTTDSVAAVRQALEAWGVTTVVVPEQGGLPRYDQTLSVPFAAALITAATGKPPIHQADAWVWTDVDKSPPPILLTTTSFFQCTSGVASGGVTAVEEVTQCMLQAPVR